MSVLILRCLWAKLVHTTHHNAPLRTEDRGMNHNSQKLLTRSSASAEGPRDAPCHRDVVNCRQHNCNNKLQDKSTTNRCNAMQLELHNRRTSSKQPRRTDSVFNKLDRQRVLLTNGRLVGVSRRNFQSPEFETKFQSFTDNSVQDRWKKPPCPNQLDSFDVFDTAPACNGQTDEQTHYAHSIYLASKASRGKNHQSNIVARRGCFK